MSLFDLIYAYTLTQMFTRIYDTHIYIHSGANHLDVAESCINLAVLLSTNGQYPEALRYFEKGMHTSLADLFFCV